MTEPINTSIEIKIAEADDLYDKEKYKEALQLYLECFDEGDLSRITQIGMIYYGKGLGVCKDLDEAEKWFEKGSEIGDFQSFILLGRVMLTKDKDCEAFKYFKKVANLGYAPGIYWVANCYAQGYCVKKSNEKAFKYYTISAKKDHFLARRARAKMLFFGRPGKCFFLNLAPMTWALS